MATKIAHQKTPSRLFLWMLTDPRQPRLVGEIFHRTDGDCALRYSPSWTASGFALSPDMPLFDTDFVPIHHLMRTSGAPGAVDDARPDRWGQKVIRYLYKPGASVYDSLYFCGHERFGALGVSTSEQAYAPFHLRTLPRLEDARTLSEAAKIIESGEGELQQQQADLISVAASLGGAKPKAAISIDGEEWVLKFFNGEPYDLPLVEYATMELARKAGINVAQVQLVPMRAENALAIKRFDRQGAARVHCISACTLLRAVTAQGADPEFGYPQLARTLRQYGKTQTLDAQLKELFCRMVFNILIANKDDHEKNHSLMCETHGRTMLMELSPGYDILPTGSGAVEHQFMISDSSKEPSLMEAMTVCAEFGLTPTQAAGLVTHLIGFVNGWQEFFKEKGISDRDIAEMVALIDAPELLEQRKSFDASQFSDTKPARKRRSGAAAFR